jgi:hypothetical protein
MTRSRRGDADSRPPSDDDSELSDGKDTAKRPAAAKI